MLYEKDERCGMRLYLLKLKEESGEGNYLII